MSFAEDLAALNAAGANLPDVRDIAFLQQPAYVRAIHEAATRVRGDDAEFAHRAAQIVETLAEMAPVTSLREEVYSHTLPDGTPAMATVLFVPREDGTVAWTFSTAVQNTPDKGYINTYHGIIGVDGVAYASMQVDGMVVDHQLPAEGRQ